MISFYLYRVFLLLFRCRLNIQDKDLGDYLDGVIFSSFHLIKSKDKYNSKKFPGNILWREKKNVLFFILKKCMDCYLTPKNE